MELTVPSKALTEAFNWNVDTLYLNGPMVWLVIGSKTLKQTWNLRETSEKILLFIAVFQSLIHVWLWDPMDYSTSCLPVLHDLLELAQTHIHRVGDANQPSHPLSSPSPPAFSLCQHRGFFLMQRLFASGDQSIGASASVPPMNIQGWFPLGLTGLILQSTGLSRVFSNTTVQKHQFFNVQPSDGPTLTSIRDYWKNHSFD